MLPSYFRLVQYNITKDNATVEVIGTPCTKQVLQAKLNDIVIPRNIIASKRTKLSLWYIVSADVDKEPYAVLYEVKPFNESATVWCKKVKDIRDRINEYLQPKFL